MTETVEALERRIDQLRVAVRVEKLWKERTPTEAMLELSRIQEEEREQDCTITSYGGNIRHALAEEQARLWREAHARGF